MVGPHAEMMDVEMIENQVLHPSLSLENVPSLESLLGDGMKSQGIDAAIEASDIGSLLEQFLEYEEVNGDAASLQKELDFLTPATSPRHSSAEEPLSVNQNSKVIMLDDHTTKECAGPTPPLTPTSDGCPSKCQDTLTNPFELQVAEEVVITTDNAETASAVEVHRRKARTERKNIPKQYRERRKRSRSPHSFDRNKKRHARSRHRHQRRNFRHASVSSASSEEDYELRRDAGIKKKPTKVSVMRDHAEYEDEFGRFHKRDCACTRCQDGPDEIDLKSQHSKNTAPLDDLHNRLAELSNPVPYDIERERKVDFLIRSEERRNSKNERRNVYVGRIPQNTTKEDLLLKFDIFGPIEKVTLHFREKCDSYAFVVFYHPEDAAKAIECGATDESCADLDLCFGGRRKFVGGSYVDFDANVSYLEENACPTNLEENVSSELDFDNLLKEAKLQQKSSHSQRR